MKYTLSDLQSDFPDDDSVLEWLINYLNPDGVVCKLCGVVTKHYKDKGRRSYSCGVCGRHMHPTAGTPFHKTKVPLIYWMYAMHRLTTTRSGFPATQLQRELGVTYTTAWRLLHKIRTHMQETGKLSGEVEIDETFLHGNVYKRSTAKRKYGRTGARRGQVVWGAVERNGRARMYHVPTAGTRVLLPIVEATVQLGSTVYSDGYRGYKTLTERGYKHYRTFHENFQWTDGLNHTQNIESLWSRFKMGIKAVYRFVSDKHLQKYCNEFSFRHSYRNAVSMFWALAGLVAAPLAFPVS